MDKTTLILTIFMVWSVVGLPQNKPLTNDTGSTGSMGSFILMGTIISSSSSISSPTSPSYSNATSTRGQTTDDGSSITFPNEDLKFNSKKYPDIDNSSPTYDTIEDPQCQPGKICNQVNNYPKEYFAKLIDQSPLYKELFEAEKPVDIGSRIGTRDAELCSSITRETSPQAVTDANGDLTYIVNQPELRQYITTDVCENPNRKCREAGQPSEGYETICVQKKMMARALGMRKGEDKIMVKYFEVPSGCCCQLRRVGNPFESKDNKK